jgi:hypothetical protein
MASTVSATTRIRLVTLASLGDDRPSSSQLELALPIAARHLAEQEGEHDALMEHFRSLADPLHSLRIYLSFLLWPCAVVLVLCLWLLFVGSTTVALIAWVLPAVPILSYFFLWPRWQHSAYARRWRARRKPAPSSIIKLISDLSACWGGAKPSAQNTDRALLDSALATLLCSHDEHDRALVRTKNGRRSRDIVVLVEVISDIHAEVSADFQSQATNANDQSDSIVKRDPIQVQASSGREIAVERTPIAIPSSTLDRLSYLPPRSGLQSNWVFGLDVTADELLDRIELIEPPIECTIPIDVLKVVLGASLTTLLKPGEEGRPKHALAAGKKAVQELKIEGYSNRESDDWIRKLIAPPLPWIKDQLSKSSRQATFNLLGDNPPRLP